MKKRALAAAMVSLFLFVGGSFAQPLPALEIRDAGICLDIVDLQCQGKDVQFSSSLGKLYCFTRVMGATTPVTITHVWYYGEKERARVTLDVRSTNWRTYSSKIIQPHETGLWRVEILGPDGTVLKALEFNVMP